MSADSVFAALSGFCILSVEPAAGSVLKPVLESLLETLFASSFISDALPSIDVVADFWFWFLFRAGF